MLAADEFVRFAIKKKQQWIAVMRSPGEYPISREICELQLEL